jgi:hypothetical protein
MFIKDLLDICDSFDDFTKFKCFDIKEDYCCNGVCFAELNRIQLCKLYGDRELRKFYIYHSSNMVDLLFKN